MEIIIKNTDLVPFSNLRRENIYKLQENILKMRLK